MSGARPLSAAEAKRRIHEKGEIAFLDVREAGPFGEGHPLFAVPCPYSTLEVSTLGLAPRLDVPLLLIDDGDGIAEKAASRLMDCGYSDVSFVEGGVAAWRKAGFGLFAGVNVPSKTLGELLEHQHHPHTIDAAVLHDWKEKGVAHFFFDARPPQEYAKMRISGARCLPNGELAHRFATVIDDTAKPVVITCAGRTRGILGALGLRAIGVANPVYALENGTQGWALAGFPLDRGATPDAFPELDAPSRAESRARANRLIERSGIATVDIGRAKAFLNASDRTTFCLDLRSLDERTGRPWPQATPVLAGQIIQATDQYVGVRNARIVLVDDTGLRAALTALFLRPLGYEPYVVALDAEPDVALDGPAPSLAGRAPEPPARIDPREVDKLRCEGAILLDVRSSQEWEKQRIEGALWVNRSRLPSAVPPEASTVLLFGDAAMVGMAALDLSDAGIATRWLPADLDACRQAGLALDTKPRRLTQDEACDRVWFVHDRHDGNAEASRQYLAWETGLIGQLDRDERAAFVEIDPALFR